MKVCVLAPGEADLLQRAAYEIDNEELTVEACEGLLADPAFVAVAAIDDSGRPLGGLLRTSFAG